MNCKQCGKDMGSLSSKCPHCGAMLEMVEADESQIEELYTPPKKGYKLWGFIFAVIILIAVLYGLRYYGRL